MLHRNTANHHPQRPFLEGHDMNCNVHNAQSSASLWQTLE
jgi:hypothetical protein